MSLVSGAVMLEQLFLGPNSIMSSTTTTISCCCCWPFFSSKGLLLLFLLYYTSAAENQEARPPQANRRINLSPAGPNYMQCCRFRRRFFLAYIIRAAKNNVLPFLHTMMHHVVCMITMIHIKIKHIFFCNSKLCFSKTDHKCPTVFNTKFI